MQSSELKLTLVRKYLHLIILLPFWGPELFATLASSRVPHTGDNGDPPSCVTGVSPSSLCSTSGVR